MNKHYRKLAALVILSGLLLSSFSFITPAAMDENERPAAQDGAGGPVQITGSFEYTNDFVVETYYVEHAVALLDMTGSSNATRNGNCP